MPFLGKLLHLYNQKISLMHDRLKQFLSMENITPSHFAEMLGIQRSGISHLLSGRNKPSYEFLQKMLTAFPELNGEWLILGKGRPYKSERPEAEKQPQPSLFTEDFDSETEENLYQPTEKQLFESDFMRSQPAENPKIEDAPCCPPAGRGKKITRIIVFYDDGSYEEK